MWMRHAVTGGYADLPDIPFWPAQGWEPVDGPPPEPDLTRDPLPAAESPEDPDTTSGSFAVQPPEGDEEGDVTRG